MRLLVVNLPHSVSASYVVQITTHHMSNSRLKRQSDLKRLDPTLFMITPGTELRIMSCSNEGFE